MKIGILTPTRGDRDVFLKHCKFQVANQTRKPDEHLVVDSKPKSSAPDITFRYRTGCDELVKRGCDVIMFIEDDDWYSHEYIEQMVALYQRNGSPEIFGIDSSIYYNIMTRKWAQFKHAGRASMMNTMCSTKALKSIKWCDDAYSYTDMYLWKTLKGKSISVDKPLAIGIKHGIGLCGGGGHVNNWKSFSNYDKDWTQLQKWVNGSLPVYKSISVDVRKYKMKPNPFMTIITRVMLGKRNGLFAQHKQSVAGLNDIDFEQQFIVDKHGGGMYLANESFQFVKPSGEYVYLLDDDDFFVRPDFIERIKQHANDTGFPDVIFFKMKIKTGDGDEIYPKPQSWKSRQPKRGQIGGSCFVVKRWVFERYIHHFAQRSCGDWYFITSVLNDADVRCSWLDERFAETGKVSRGAVE